MELPFLSKVYLTLGISTPQYEALSGMIIIYYTFNIGNLGYTPSSTFHCIHSPETSFLLPLLHLYWDKNTQLAVMDMLQSLPCPKCEYASYPSWAHTPLCGLTVYDDVHYGDIL